jgi:hypothetical protein
LFSPTVHLIGSKDDREWKRTVKTIGRETNCTIMVNCPKKDSPRNKLFPITISIRPHKSSNYRRKPFNKYGHDYSRVGGSPTPSSCTLSNTEINDLMRERMVCKIRRDFNRADSIEYDLKAAGVLLNHRSKEWRADGLHKNYKDWDVDREELDSDLPSTDDAREKVQELLLEYMDLKQNSSAKGRLIYEIASSCAGPHNPRDSTSNAIRWRGPNGSGFLSLVELPFEFINGKKSFHAHMIMQTQNNLRLKDLGCLTKVFGDDMRLKHCDPYALVSGGSWQVVDEAVEIVRDAIKAHMRTCCCSYSSQCVSKGQTGKRQFGALYQE